MILSGEKKTCQLVIQPAKGGRHNRAAGFVADAEKYLEAVLAGWRVVRLVNSQLTLETVGRVAAMVRSGKKSDPVPDR